MSTIQDLLARAFQLHQAGRLPEAERLYQKILSLEPDNAQVLHLAGTAAHQQGRHQQAIDFIRRALEVRPGEPAWLTNLGAALGALGRFDEAEDCFRRGLALRPQDAPLWHNLAVVQRRQGRLAEALASYDESLRLDPNSAEVHTHKGAALQKLNRTDEAIAAHKRALDLRPDLAEAHNNLAVSLRQARRLDEALAHYQRAIDLRPRYAEARNNLGTLLADLGRLPEAELALRDSLALRPDHVDTLANLGHVLTERGKLDEAVHVLEGALVRQPDSALLHNNLGTALLRRGELGRALASFDRAVAIDPVYARARTNRGQVLLMQGRFEDGWREYEWRRRAPDWPGPRMTGPMWEGTDPAGRTILVRAEQGLGDTLQFIRYARLLAEREARVLFECPPPLVRLLSGCDYLASVIPRGETLPAFDAEIPLLSLPRLLGTTLDTIPASSPYLKADDGLVAHWRARLAPQRGTLVGIAWRGNPLNPAHERSIPVRHFARLAGLAGVRLVSLQKDGAEELSAAGISSVDVRPLDGPHGPFMDTAAIMTLADLVITSDTSIPHLSGGLGVRTWLALPAVADWRWLVDREDSPWYGSARLYRQRRAGDWTEVFDRVVRDLDAMVRRPPQEQADGY
jgi:tetratricopeptide (TPR) repeat protein